MPTEPSFGTTKQGKAGITFDCKSSSVRARLSDWLSDPFFMRLEGDLARFLPRGKIQQEPVALGLSHCQRQSVGSCPTPATWRSFDPAMHECDFRRLSCIDKPLRKRSIGSNARVLRMSISSVPCPSSLDFEESNSGSPIGTLEVRTLYL